MKQLKEYIKNLNKHFQTGIAGEHAYRGDLENLLKTIIDKNITIINEPAKIEKIIGRPDFSLTKNGVPIGYIETKDINKNLYSKEHKKQFEKYKNGLDNLIISNYIDFIFFRFGKEIIKISIAKIENNRIVGISENFEEFINLIKYFTDFISRSINSPLKLAEMMATRTILLKNMLIKTLNDKESSAYSQYQVFKKSLIHDITTDEFADIYAQTIAFGMFIARFHDDKLDNFSREEARKLIPTSHLFLKGLFKYISDDDEVDSKIIWVIDSLAELFLATDIKELFKNRHDPIIHFYETFLSKYNPQIRKSRGVWYTPKEVVDFIIKSIDEVLKDEFKLEGLIDETKITIKVPTGEYTSSGKEKLKQKEIHKIQILDPATGTGTFLASVVEFIKKDFFGNWGEYVEKDLIPRLNGFELLMASYAMAHLKMDMVLSDEKYQPKSKLNIYLTNSLEPPHKEYQT